MRVASLVIGLTILLGACGQEEPPPAPKPKPAPKLPHCFFKDGEAKGWALSRQGSDIVVKGRAYRSDARYKTVFLVPEINGGTAVVRPSIAVNDTGFATDDNWWDIEARVPAAGIETVEVRCGKTLLATLPAEPTGG